MQTRVSFIVYRVYRYFQIQYVYRYDSGTQNSNTMWRIRSIFVFFHIIRVFYCLKGQTLVTISENMKLPIRNFVFTNKMGYLYYRRYRPKMCKYIYIYMATVGRILTGFYLTSLESKKNIWIQEYYILFEPKTWKNNFVYA